MLCAAIDIFDCRLSAGANFLSSDKENALPIAVCYCSRRLCIHDTRKLFGDTFPTGPGYLNVKLCICLL